ncbi:hypothetical protein ACYOEI_37380, partial [Singulisphaera rosea]
MDRISPRLDRRTPSPSIRRRRRRPAVSEGVTLALEWLEDRTLLASGLATNTSPLIHVQAAATTTTPL